MLKIHSIMCFIIVIISTQGLNNDLGIVSHRITQPRSHQAAGQKRGLSAAEIACILTGEIMKNKLGKDRILSHITKEAFQFPGKFGQLSLGDSNKVYRAMN